MGLSTVRKLPGHQRMETTSIYAHFEIRASLGAVVQTATVIANAMKVETSRPRQQLFATDAPSHSEIPSTNPLQEPPLQEPFTQQFTEFFAMRPPFLPSPLVFIVSKYCQPGSRVEIQPQ